MGSAVGTTARGRTARSRTARATLGVDTGGTFTDVVLADEEGDLRACKSVTTPRDHAVGVLKGIRKSGISGAALRSITYGTTIGLNAIVTRNGARVALLHTAGFRDLLDMGRAWRPHHDCVNPRYLRPHEERPIVPRRFRRPVEERVLADGTVLIPLSDERSDDLGRQLDRLVAEGIESIAVCLLHSYKYPDHERRVKAFIEARYPQLSIDVSSDVCPYPKEYGRTMTTVLNAFIRPSMQRAFEGLERKLLEWGYCGQTWIGTNQGGMTTIGEAKLRPVLTLGSGPVGGVLGAKRLAAGLQLENVITLDMGGTSADVSILSDGQMARTRELEFEHDIICTVPVIDVRSIGAGGGSIAWLDPAGAMNVGPQSAGSDPGPACYSRGGTEPTVTDAWLVLNVLSAAEPLGGEIRLDAARARTAMRRIAEPLHVSVEEAARLIVRVAANNMAELIREMTVYRGLDPRDYALIAFGAAGPLAAAAIARELEIPTVWVPSLAGAFSAYGLNQADFVCERTRPVMGVLQELPEVSLTETFSALAEETVARIREHGIARRDISVAMSFDGMYVGQSWELTTQLPPLPETGVGQSLTAAFNDTHELLRGYKLDQMPIRILTARVTGFGRRAARNGRKRAGVAGAEGRASQPGKGALIGRRPVWFGSRVLETPCYRVRALKPGNVVAGPAVLHDENFTVLLQPGDEGHIDEQRNCRIAIERG
jgi:N-methylhydantoinase A